MYPINRYGQSKIEHCPFCEKRALLKNLQGIPVCPDHKKQELTDRKCACGSWLELRTGKYGAYFNCLRCGNINFKRALEMSQPLQNRPAKEESKTPKPRETTITSDEVDLY